MNYHGWIAGALVTVVVVLLAGGWGMCKSIQLTDEMDNLETEWLFRIDPADVGLKDGWATSTFKDADWRGIRVPGTWETQGVTMPASPKPADSTAAAPPIGYDGVAWYRIHFVAPASWGAQNLKLHLGSIDDQDQVFLNGKLIGATGPGIENSVLVQRRYDIRGSQLVIGKDNILAVRVSDNGGPGGMLGPYVYLLPEGVVKSRMIVPQSDRPLNSRFQNPPADCRMLKIIHGWPDDPEAQDGAIRALISQGFGGVACNLSFTDYLQSEQRWGYLKRALTEAKNAGMAMWLYDERGYPSGTAGGLTLKDHPEWIVRGLLTADSITDGGEVRLDVPPGKLILAAAYPISATGIDLNKGIDIASGVSDRTLTWTAPLGQWHAMVVTEDTLYDHTFVAGGLGDKIPYINLLMPEPTARFLELTHQAYADHLGGDLGKYFISTFTDEPSLMNRWVDAAPYRALPWSTNLVTEFRKRRGYDLQPLVPILLADAGERSSAVRYDFWQTVGELVSENYFGQIQTWCKQHNIASEGHLVQEEPILDHVAFYGNFFQCVRRMDAPGIDCLTSVPSQAPPHIARMISSAGDLEGHTVTMSETSDFGQFYRMPGDTRPTTTVTEEEIRGTCNLLMLGGINTITSYYSFGGLASKQIRRLNEWVGRCATMLRGGHHALDIAVLYPVESIWPKFSPARSGPTDSPAARQIEHTFQLVSDALYASRREFSYIDSQAIRDARVDSGYLVNGALRWHVIVLPNVDTLPLELWVKLQEFQRSGGALIAVGAMPANSEKEFPSAKVMAIGKAMFGESDGMKFAASPSGGVGAFLPDGAEIQFAAVMDSLIEPDIAISDRKAPVRMTHRSIDGHEVFFIINDSSIPWKGSVSVAAQGKGELFDPSDGKITAIQGPGNIKLDLQAFDAVVLRFAKARPLVHRKISNGSLAMPALSRLPMTTPSITSGEFVRGEMLDDAEKSKPGLPVWRAIGAITKGQADTYAFLLFSYPKALDLSAEDLLSFDTWVPDGQSSAASCMVMLHEKDGGDYISVTGLSLNLPGHRRLVIPLESFQLGPWSKDADGRINLKQIDRIIIGWGGYFGKEGERLEFSAGSPQVGRYSQQAGGDR